MNSFFRQIYSHTIIGLILSGMGTIFVHGTNNYPAKDYTRKACTRLNNTIVFQKEICIPNGQGGFEEISENNCKDLFKKTCPEFNQASCKWYKSVPCCRLKYFAERITWMEIYYTLQYSYLNVSFVNHDFVYDIIEVNRLIKKHKVFVNRDQPDWPSNALDSKGERGLHWVTFNQNWLPINVDTCRQEYDDHCSAPDGGLYKYIMANYREGFENFTIQPSPLETRHGMNATISHDLRCIKIAVPYNSDKVYTSYPACQILYRRTASSATAPFNTSFIYLEANIFLDSKNKYFIRFAYWSQEDPEMRDKIFPV